jgi:hypothetical protein
MKLVRASVTVESDGKNYTQPIAGGIPIAGGGGWIVLDGSSHQEILTKLFMNTMAVYVTSQFPDKQEEWSKALREGRESVYDFLNKYP